MKTEWFDNTEFAFGHKSDAELTRALLLFRVFARPQLVNSGKTLINASRKIGLPVRWIMKPTVFRHFCGGETLDSCKPLVDKLAQFGVSSILDFSAEAGNEISAIETAVRETLASINFSSQNKNLAYSVFKPSALIPAGILEKVSQRAPLTPSEKKSYDLFCHYFRLLCQTAAEKKVRILVDAEHVAMQPAIDEITDQLMAEFNKQQAIVFNTFQMYRTDRLAFIEASYQKALAGGYYLGAKLVRGAYIEQERQLACEKGLPSPVFDTIEQTHQSYNNALTFCIEHIDRIELFNGTHNEESCMHLANLMKTHNLAKNDERIFTSQLYGMGDHISFNMAKEGYHVCKYIPYGPVDVVIPYLIRRAEENTSVQGQIGRELRLLLTERKRRKLQS